MAKLKEADAQSSDSDKSEVEAAQNEQVSALEKRIYELEGEFLAFKHLPKSEATTDLKQETPGTNSNEIK